MKQGVPKSVDDYIAVQPEAVRPKLEQVLTRARLEHTLRATSEDEINYDVELPLDGKTDRLRNPFPPRSLPWAAWIIARLGGWHGASNGKPAGPITMHRGLQCFHAIAHGFRLKDVSVR